MSLQQKGEISMKEKINLIIADTNNMIIDILKNYIKEDNRFNITGIANDEIEEVKLIELLKPDLIISNIKKNNGWTGINIIKKYQNEEYNPIIFIISGSIYDYIKEIESQNIQYFLNKPFKKEQLLNTLNEIYTNYINKH